MHFELKHLVENYFEVYLRSLGDICFPNETLQLCKYIKEDIRFTIIGNMFFTSKEIKDISKFKTFLHKKFVYIMSR